MTKLAHGVRGKDKLDVPIKMIFNYAGNTITNQHSDINRTHEILQDESKCEFIVVWETFMTDSAKYADVLLPDLMPVGSRTYRLERLRRQHGLDHHGPAGHLAEVRTAHAVRRSA